MKKRYFLVTGFLMLAFATGFSQALIPQTDYHENGKVKATYFTLNDKMEGDYVQFYESGRREITTNFKNGLLEGEFNVFHENGLLAKKYIFKADLADGDFKEYTETGQILKSGTFKADKLDGAYVEFTPYGQLAITTRYSNGLKEGEEKVYERGNLKTKSFYSGDVKHGEEVSYYTYETGELILSKVMYVNGKKEGPYLQYYRNGDLMVTVNYKNDLKEGEERSFHDNGNLSVVKYYKGGKPEGESISYFQDGKTPKVRILHINGEFNKEGYHKEYYANGNLLHWVDYKKNGSEIRKKEYFENGTLHYSTLITKDNNNVELNTREEFSIKGIPVSSMQTFNGRTLWEKKFHENGKLKEWFDFNSGTVKYYDKNANLMRTEYLHSGYLD